MDRSSPHEVDRAGTRSGSKRESRDSHAGERPALFTATVGVRPGRIAQIYYFLPPEPASAVATPSEISIPPDTYRCVRNQRVFRFRWRATVPAKNAQRLSLTTPIPAKSVPKKRICNARFPRDASTNCGRKAKKKSAVFGFRI